MLRFDTSGIPRSGTDHGIRRARELGLDGLEMAWVNGIRMGEAMADRIAAAAWDALKDCRVSGWVICESPAMEDDAVHLQRTYRRLR